MKYEVLQSSLIHEPLCQVRRKLDLMDSHEAAIQRHKDSLKRQLERGQILEGVQKLTVNYDLASNKNIEEHQLLADNILSSLPAPGP